MPGGTQRWYAWVYEWPPPWKHPSGVYYFRQRVPADLVGKLGYAVEKVSLRTKNEREAIRKFRIIAAEHQARWDEMRKGEQSFTHRQGYLVDDITYKMILDAANMAAIQSMQIFSRNVVGDYSEDPKIARFPKFEVVQAQNPEHKFDRLWEGYCKARKPSPKTIKKWLPYFDLLIALVCTDDMSQVTTAHLISWRDHLQERAENSPRNQRMLCAENPP